MFPFNMMDSLFSIFFVLVFGTAITVFVVVGVRSIRQWNRNNASPRLTVPARVVAKRMSISGPRTGEVMHSTTRYFITFQVESGDRMELYVPATDFSMIAEHDSGQLSFQGTRFLGFARS